MQRFGCEMHLIIKEARVKVQELIKQCLLDNPNAQKLLFEKFVTPMVRLCLRYLKDHEIAKDTMMDGFMKVFSQLKHFEYQGEHSLGMWIRRIMVNQCPMQLRKDRTRLLMDVSDHLEKNEITDDYSQLKEEAYRRMRDIAEKEFKVYY
jgi:RNA polymerase sigma-70 factor (ECF subfamily)